MNRALPSSVRELAAEKKYAQFITPMLASIGGEAFTDPDWVFEIKWDGYRAVAEIKKGKVKLYSRNGLSFERKYADVAEALTKVKHNVVLDGEIVVLDKTGKPSFQLLQHYPDIDEPHAIAYYVFDVLELDGKKLYKLPLLERKAILQKLLPKSDTIQYCDHVEKDGKKLFAALTKKGMEGMIAKKSDSLYFAGKRSGDWLKIRNHKIEEVIICGYTEPRGGRKYFGSVILGMYQGRELIYVGHAGTGFDDKSLRELHAKMEKLENGKMPFKEKPSHTSAPHWVSPVLVCNIKYTERTRDNQLRHPVFMGLRADKKAGEVKLKPAKK